MAVMPGTIVKKREKSICVEASHLICNAGCISTMCGGFAGGFPFLICSAYSRGYPMATHGLLSTWSSNTLPQDLPCDCDGLNRHRFGGSTMTFPGKPILIPLLPAKCISQSDSGG